MARQDIKFGNYPNDPNADSNYQAWKKVNEMMKEIYPELDYTLEGIEPYETKADMDSVTPGSGDPKISIVMNDSTASNNGWYRWDSGSTSWVKRDEFYATDPEVDGEDISSKSTAPIYLKRYFEENATRQNIIKSHVNRGFVGEVMDPDNYMFASGNCKLTQHPASNFNYDGLELKLDFDSGINYYLRYYVTDQEILEDYSFIAEIHSDKQFDLRLRVLDENDTGITDKTVTITAGYNKIYIDYTVPSGVSTTIYNMIYTTSDISTADIRVGRVARVKGSAEGLKFTEIIEFTPDSISDLLGDYNGYGIKNGQISLDGSIDPFSAVKASNFSYTGYATKFPAASRTNFWIAASADDTLGITKGIFVAEFYSAIDIQIKVRVLEKTDTAEPDIANIKTFTLKSGEVTQIVMPFEASTSDYDELRFRFFDVAGDSISGNEFFIGRVALFESPYSNVSEGITGNKGIYFKAPGSSSLVFLGDSLTAQGYGDYVASELGVTGLNEGVGGEESFQIFKRFEGKPELHDYPTVIWIGRNNIGDPNFKEEVIRDVEKTVGLLTHHNYIVMGVTTGDYTSERKGGSRYQANVELTNELHSMYGPKFLDTRKALINRWDYLGIELTSSFTQPAVNSTVSIPLSDTSDLTAGEDIRIGWFTSADKYNIVSVDSSTSITAKLLQANRISEGSTVENKTVTETGETTATNYLLVCKDADFIDRNDQIIPGSLRSDSVHLNESGKQLLAGIVSDHIITNNII